MVWNPFSSKAAPPPPPSDLPSDPSTPPTKQSGPQISVSNAISSSLAPANSSSSTDTAARPGIAIQQQAVKSVDEQYRDFKAILGMGLIGICPLLMLLPPRRFNAITVIQGGMFTWGVNEQTAYRTGHDLIGHYNRWVTCDPKSSKQ